MLLWHVGGALFLFRWIFRDPGVDVRFLVFGAILPDLIDLPLGTILLADKYSSGRLWAHSLLAPTVLGVATLVFTRRGARRKAWIAIAVGMFFHLLLDGMWRVTEVFAWPLFGDFPKGASPFWPAAWSRALSDPIRWLEEIAGLAYLVALWRRAGLADPGARRRLISEGRLAA
jgi:membrane-bound metal-dependent hydrolase YbcI (DUF457 family)